MYCTIYIKTKENLDHYRKELVDYIGSAKLEKIKNKTTQNELTHEYFCGKTNEKVHYLIREDIADSFTIFIEGAKQRNNLAQLVTGVEQVFDDVKSLLDKLEVNCIKISASIWSEDEEMLTGVYQNYGVRFRSLIPDIPTGIYLAALTIIYSVLQPKIEGAGVTTGTFLIAGINMLIVLLASLAWLLVKAYKRERNLSFKIKK